MSHPPLKQDRREEETVPVRIRRVTRATSEDVEDVVTVEEPLEIRLTYGPLGVRQEIPLSLTLRTPGDDCDLAAGFLLTEGILRSREDIHRLYGCGPIQEPGGYQNIVRAELTPETPFRPERFQRHFYTTSSCGVCGKTSLDALEAGLESRAALSDRLRIPATLLFTLPDRLRERQAVFGRTGGLHAAALFTADGSPVILREDVGRHNALDKLIGNRLMSRQLPLSEHILLLSGRASFELLQKAFVAGTPLVCAVGAPSSLAVELADRFGITLVGWLRGERMNIYTHPERIT